jgi:hypothetical protein
MSRKLATLLLPFLLAPLGLFFTPLVVRAQYIRTTRFQDCVFSSFPRRNYTPVRLRLQFTSRDAVRVTKIETSNTNTENIRQLRVWETQNRRTVSSQVYGYVPPRKYVNQPLKLAWLKHGGNRSATVWLFNADTNVCKTTFRF